MPSGATYPAEGHLRISNEWLNDNATDKNAVIYCQWRDGKNPKHDSTANGRTGMPRGVMIQGNSTADGNAAFVRGYLIDETPSDTDDHYLNAGMMHPLRFKRIYAQGTTARGVRIYY